MSTFSQMVDDTLLYLYGFTSQQDNATYLTAGVSDSSTTLPIADAASISRGLVEIGDELIWVDSVNASALSATVPPYGRGFRGTTPVLHLTGERVTSSPMFPRVTVKRALNETIQSVFPDVFGVGTTTFTYNPAINTYALPAGAQDILAVTWQTIGPTREWKPVRRWAVDGNADTTAFPTGATISLFDGIVPGRTVKVVYTKVPNVMALDADNFTTVTGLPSSMEDVIRLGAASRMVAFLDAAHLTGQSAESDFSSNMRPNGGAGQLSKYLLQMYQIRLQEERGKLQTLYPARTHYTR